MEDTRERHKSICSECGHEFYACKSMGQSMGDNSAGCGSCPKCRTFLNLTFNEDTQEMKTKEWGKWINDNRKI